ncbi:hypothetical protein RFI_25350 [Reticulomyxa filosa]|uniref:Kelch motif family protein n=1 Tax=Reticulomyxa filosa TaxID=46433 RepID=X6MED2_RETFI|nr:hypothetical protein RFI_25350 [Reticulomyxa filosa]|eukprot:ETO12026.1 hypothetical protein RFI_25350 [Reticulomyxa filosa]
MDLNNAKMEEVANTDIASTFEALAPLPIPLYLNQCVTYKQEILVCGGNSEGGCYSYHLLKNQYKYICSYPSNVELRGHCVVKCVNNNNPDEITLLSFGGQGKHKKHTLMMKYVSIWDNLEVEDKRNFNRWVPFIDSRNKQILIGRDDDNYIGARAVISGSRNHLLFITYYPNNISVYDLSTFQFVKHSTLPNRMFIGYHCFVSKTENVSSAMKRYANNTQNELILFCKSTGLSIEYDEDKQKLYFNKLRICTALRQFISYGFIRINDFIVLFGGNDNSNTTASGEIYKYSLTENKWIKFEQNLPIPLTDCAVAVSENSAYLHIIGGFDGKEALLSHVKIKMETLIQQEETETEKRGLQKKKKKKKLRTLKKN